MYLTPAVSDFGVKIYKIVFPKLECHLVDYSKLSPLNPRRCSYGKRIMLEYFHDRSRFGAIYRKMA